MTISEELMKILACPQCRAAVRLEEGGARIICDRCRLAYPVRDAIPVMLVDEAERL